MNRAIKLAITLAKADLVVIAGFGALPENDLKILFAQCKVAIVEWIQACTITAPVTPVWTVLTTWTVF